MTSELRPSTNHFSDNLSRFTADMVTMRLPLSLLCLSYFPMVCFGVQNSQSLAGEANRLLVGMAGTGLNSIKFRKVEYLARGNFLVNAVQFSTQQAQGKQTNLIGKTSYDAVHANGTMQYDWGVITVNYRPQKNSLLLTIKTENRTDSTITALSYDVLALRFSTAPRQFDGVTPMLASNLGAPTAILLADEKTTVVLCDEDVRRPLLVGFPWALDKPANRVFPIRINTGREPMYPNSLPTINRPIPPHSTDVMHLSLRFGDSAQTVGGLAPDVFQQFVEAYPYSVNWPDRRPIGSLTLATSGQHWAGNPRGWFLDPKLDTASAYGKVGFRKRLLDWADQSVAILTFMDAQGMVTWDVEGEQYAHPTTYIGDPERAFQLAPELNGVLDEYFARFTRAGLRVGLTIRPQMLRIAPGQEPAQTEVSDPSAVLIRKIAYAKKRWHASLFYLDSNGNTGNPTDYNVIESVRKAHPDVLLIPEHKSIAYYALTAPYQELRSGIAATPASVRKIYPRAFSVINVADGPVEASLIELRRAVHEGDILMVRGWFADPINAKVHGIYLNGSPW